MILYVLINRDRVEYPNSRSRFFDWRHTRALVHRLDGSFFILLTVVVTYLINDIIVIGIHRFLCKFTSSEGVRTIPVTAVNEKGHKSLCARFSMSAE